MPVSSIDTILACSIMIILVSSAMAITSTTLNPSLNEISNRNDIERYHQLARYILLNPGSPSNWGCMSKVVPISFGLASEGSSHPFQLDVDKVTRLNVENVYSLTYPQIHGALGVPDISLGVELHPLFDLSSDLISNVEKENQTTYTFEISAKYSQLPTKSQLSCYIISKGYIDHAILSTSSNGSTFPSFTLPNSANGTALLVSFAKIGARIMSFDVYPFNHHASAPKPVGTFMKLNPINQTLNVSFSITNQEVVRAQVFTYNYTSEMILIAEENKTAEYSFPHILDASIMIMVVTGNNGSSTYAEWVSYPQLPLEMRSDSDNIGNSAKIVSLSYIVTINNVLYKCAINFVGS